MLRTKDEIRGRVVAKHNRTQLYSFSAILVFHPIFLKYRSRDCSVTGCRNDVQKRAPFLSLSLSRPRFFHDPRFSGIVESIALYLRVAVRYGGKFLIRDFLFSSGNLTVFGTDRRYKPGLRSRLFSKMRILCTRLSFAVSCFSILDASLFLI